jgi:GNAT superfamily N-acetyltransferase
METVPFAATHIPAAAAMFAARLRALRTAVPALATRLADEAVLTTLLEGMVGHGWAALEDSRLVGYLASWYPIEHFRGANRAGAYAPEWAHGAAWDRALVIYRALYRAASAQWAEAGCGVHAITLLADDAEGTDAWFRHGFGLTVVDAVRPCIPIEVAPREGMTVRAATLPDANTLAFLDSEHVRHYEAPPVFMAPPAVFTPRRWREWLMRPGNTAWLAEDAGGPCGFIRFDANDYDGVEALNGLGAVLINGAYVRPACRGRGAAPALLDAALRHYAAQGYTACNVNFESFNPEAAAFWPRYFTPVCNSLTRAPEWP